MSDKKIFQDNVARVASASKYINPEVQPDSDGKKEVSAKKPTLAPKPEVKGKPNEITTERSTTDKAREQINQLKFPQLNDANKPFGTKENIEYMLKFYGVTVAYDVITKDITITIPGLESSVDNYRSMVEAELVSLAMLNGIHSANFERFVTAIANKNQVNPIMQWVESKSWDNKDRIPEFCATITVADNFPDEFKDLLIQKWLLSGVAAAAMPFGFSSRGVLTLQGSQGIGKTRWISNLVNDAKLASESILIDHHMDASNKDALISAVKHWIVEIGELDSSFKKDVARLKGFITNKEDKIRVPYARRESLFPRRTVFAATVNDDEFLIDQTGNTRWWTLPCTHTDHRHTIDMQQLWAQVYEQQFKDVKSPQWWLTDDEQDQLEELNAHHKKRTAIEDLLESELLFDAPEDDWTRLTASEVLIAVGIARPTNQQAKECASFLRQRIGQPTRSQGKVRWLVPPTSEAWQPLGETMKPQVKPIHLDEDDPDKY